MKDTFGFGFGGGGVGGGVGDGQCAWEQVASASERRQTEARLKREIRLFDNVLELLIRKSFGSPGTTSRARDNNKED